MAAKTVRPQTAAQIDATKFALWVIATSVISAAAALSTLVASLPR
jgi:hypothetical protein